MPITMSYIYKILSLILATVETCMLFTSQETMYFYEHFNQLSSNRAKIANAVKNAPSDVPSLTFKCAILTGVFTWLIHTLCGAPMIFVPSVLGVILAPSPVLDSYWCALPTMLYLWLNEGRMFAAITLILLQFLAPPYLEATLYVEKNGGGSHYLICVAMAIGMYWLGLQGTTLVPILLCYFFDTFEQAAVSVSSNEDESNRISAGNQKSKIQTNDYVYCQNSAIAI